MNPYRQALYEALKPVLKAAGYERRGSSWYRRSPECVVVVNVDKSPHGQQYQVNLAVGLLALQRTEWPLEHHCDIRLRLNEFVPDRARLEALLDFDELGPGETPQLRAAEIATLVEDAGLPWLARLASEAGVRAFIGTPLASRGLVSRAARDRLAGQQAS